MLHVVSYQPMSSRATTAGGLSKATIFAENSRLFRIRVLSSKELIIVVIVVWFISNIVKLAKLKWRSRSRDCVP